MRTRIMASLEHVAHIGRRVLALLFLGSSAAKAWNITAIIPALAFLSPFQPGPWMLPAALGVVAREAALACLLVSRSPRTANLGLYLALGTVLLLSAALVRLLAEPNAPGCGCFGASMFGKDAQLENALALARNASILCLVIWLLHQSRAAGVATIHRGACP